MTDFYSVLMNSLNRRDVWDPAERERVYVHARMAMIRRLWSFQPALSNEEIEEKIGMFDAAVERIEAELEDEQASAAAEALRLAPEVAVAGEPPAPEPIAEPPAPPPRPAAVQPPPAAEDPWDDDAPMPEVAAPHLAGPDAAEPAPPPPLPMPPVDRPRRADFLSGTAWPAPVPPAAPAAGLGADPDEALPLPPGRGRGRELNGWGDEPPPGRWQAPGEASGEEPAAEAPPPAAGSRPDQLAAARDLLARGLAWRPRFPARRAAEPAAPRPDAAAPAPAARGSERRVPAPIAWFARRRRPEDDPTQHLRGRIRPPRSAARGAPAQTAATPERDAWSDEAADPWSAEDGPAAGAPAAPAAPETRSEPPVQPRAEAPFTQAPLTQTTFEERLAAAMASEPGDTAWRDQPAAAEDEPWDGPADGAYDGAAAPAPAPAEEEFAPADPLPSDDGEALDGSAPRPLAGEAPPAPLPVAPRRARPLLPRPAALLPARRRAASAEPDGDAAFVEEDEPPARRVRPRLLAPGRILAASVALLAVIVVGWSAYLLYPLFAGGDTVVDAGPASDGAAPGGEGAPGLAGPAADVAESIVLFNGLNPTVFESSAENPVQFDGDAEDGHVRVASSADSAGARAVVGPGVADRLAGRAIRVTVVARSSTDLGAGTIRFAYLAGGVISPWKTALLSESYSALDLAWQVPARGGDGNDYILIEPGVPGEGTGVDIQEIRIDVLRP